MIELTRFLGYRPKRAEPKPDAVVWRNLPTDGSVKVTAGPYFGSMQDGVYLGLVSDGLLAIKLNTDGFVRECRAAMVTLAEEVHEDYREERTPVADLLSKSAQDTQVDAAPVSNAAEAAVAVDEPVDDHVEEMPEFSWDSIAKDSPVWVSRGDDQDTLEGVFLKVLEDGKLSIKIEGEKKPRSFNKETVLYAG